MFIAWNFLRQMKTFLVELIKWIILTGSIDWFHGLTGYVSIFFLLLFFWKKLNMISLFSVYYKLIQIRYFWWCSFSIRFNLLEGLFRGDWWYILTSNYQSAECAFSDETCSSITVFIIVLKDASINVFFKEFFSFS